MQEAFDEAVEKKVQERLATAVSAAETNFDAVMNERLEKLVEKMEEANKAGLKRVYNTLNEKAQKMKAVYEDRVRTLKERNEKLAAEAVRERKLSTSRFLNERRVLVGMNKQKVQEVEEMGRQAIATLVERFESAVLAEREGALKVIAAMKQRNDREMLREAKAFKKRLVETVGSFLDHEIDSKIPYEDVRESLRNQSAMKLVKTLKDILSVDNASTMEVIKAPINEARQMITESRKENAGLITENAKLRDIIDEKNKAMVALQESANAKIEKARKVIAEARRVAHLNEKLSTIPSLEQRKFVKNLMEGQSIEFIDSQWDYALKRYRTNRAQENAALAKKAASEAKSTELAEVTRRHLTEATQRVREAKREMEVRQAPKRVGRDALIDDIIENGNY